MLGRKRRRADVHEVGGEFEIAGKVLSCHHCGETAFTRKLVMMNTSGLTLLGMDWANREAICYSCDNCGFVHWFRH